MAGGRRPANYAAGTATRHTASERDIGATSYYSIWQQPPLTVTTSPPPPAAIPGPSDAVILPPHTLPSSSGLKPYQYLQDPSVDQATRFDVAHSASGALAAALDAAVTVAVQRALSSSTLSPTGRDCNSETIQGLPQDTFDEQDHAHSIASSSFNHVVGNASRTSSVSGERERERDTEFSNLVEFHVEAESQERKKEAGNLRDMILRLETRLQESESTYERKISALQSRLDTAEAAAVESQQFLSQVQLENRQLKEQLKGINKTVADNRTQKRKMDSDYDRVRNRLSHIEGQVDQCWDALTAMHRRSEDMEHSVASISDLRAQLDKNNVAANEVSLALTSAQSALRSGNDALEGIAGLRSRMKRLESTVDTAGKRTEEALALQGGAVDGIRITASETSASVQALKRLVETNLRSHSSAEGIVKEQAQLITRHVCSALRQFICRRITENNVLVDKVLRARIPAYASAGDEYVLVREHEAEPEDEPGSASCSSSVSAKQTGAAVIPREVLDRAIADFDATSESVADATSK